MIGDKHVCARVHVLTEARTCMYLLVSEYNYAFIIHAHIYFMCSQDITHVVLDRVWGGFQTSQ